MATAWPRKESAPLRAAQVFVDRRNKLSEAVRLREKSNRLGQRGQLRALKARREHDAGLGLSNRGFRRDLQPVGAVWHVEVGHYHREPGVAAQEDEGLIPVAGGSDLEALRGQSLYDDAAEIVFVFNKQHVDRPLNALVRGSKG